MGVSAWAAVGGRESRGLGPGTLSAKPASCRLGLERSLPPSVGWASFLQALDQTPGWKLGSVPTPSEEEVRSWASIPRRPRGAARAAVTGIDVLWRELRKTKSCPDLPLRPPAL